MEFNDSLHIPPHLRYDLTVPETSNALPSTESQEAATVFPDELSAKSALRKAKARLTSREISPDTYRVTEDEVRQSGLFAPGLQLTSLLKVSHTEPRDNPAVAGEMETALGFLTPEQETEYLDALDSRLDGESPITTPHKTNQPSDKSPIDKDKETALQNPVSVYNWLRKHQPQVFLQDNESNPEKPEKPPSRPTNSRTSKRTAAQMQKEEEPYDEDGILLPDLGKATGGGGSSRGKRKRDEDGGYRPKGGSSRPSKKRKEKDDNAYSGKRAKKSSLPGPGA